jgi:hypothetical protein
VRQGDNHLHLLPFQQRQVRSGGLERIDQPDAREAVLRRSLARDAQADEAHFERAERLHDVGRGAADRFARLLVDHIGDDPLPPRFPHPLDEHVGTEVEFVVPECGEVEAGGVQRRDHLFALEHGRGDRRGQKVAGQHEERCASLGRELPFERRDPREPARAVDRKR